MDSVFATRDLTKRFDEVVALDHVDLTIDGHSIVGLLGRNGSGKTTLLNHLMGLQLPSEGSVMTLGVPAETIDHEQLVQIGFVPQEIRLLDWMTVDQHLRYVSSFYPRWDLERQNQLACELELDPQALVGSLSTGNLQKLAIILAVCHHPTLLVLDEPVSDLDPIVRGKLLEFLLDLLREDRATIIISSHVLRDVERIVDWVLCLDRGRLVTDQGLDDLKERYVEWLVTWGDSDLPLRFTETYILEQEIHGREAKILVDQRGSDLGRFRSHHSVEVTPRPLNLEEMFPLLVRQEGDQ